MGSDNKLIKLRDEATILTLLSNSKDGNDEIFIWKLIGGSKHLCQVRIESIRRTRKDFCVIPADGQDRLVQDLMGSTGSVDLYIPNSSLLLRCQIKQTDAPYRYYLQLPSFVAQVDRRKDFRLNVHSGSEVRVSFGKSVSGSRPMSQYFLKDCFDISTGGFSFFISKMETGFFKPEDILTTVDLKTNDWTAKASAEIVAIREVEPDDENGLTYKVWRVSCKFAQIDQISKKSIEKFIFERIKKELHAIND